MREFWSRVTPKFSYVLERMPRLTASGFRELRGGELLALQTSGGWVVQAESDPSKINPRRPTIYLSRGRWPGEEGLAFEAVERLSRILYEIASDSPENAKGAALVAATWYYPEWDWYINRPVVNREDLGFPTTEGMWGTIVGPEFQAEGVVVVCRHLGWKESRERALKIRKGGFPGPKDWSPTGRLPEEHWRS